jgi:hypothetical protein
MRTFLKAICVLLGSAFAVVGNCSETLRANLEITVVDGKDHQTIKTASAVVPGTPLKFNLGKYELGLVFLIDQAVTNKYTMTVSLATPKKSSNALSVPILTQSFQSGLISQGNGPLEFKAEKHGITVSGAVALAGVSQ